MHWRRQWQATPVLLPRKPNGWRSLVGCSPCGRYELDATERLHFHFSLSHNGGGNGNPLQCSCLENPRDWGAWWAAVYGVAQSRTRLKRLSSSSSSDSPPFPSPITSSAGFSFLRALDVEVAQTLHLGLLSAPVHTRQAVSSGCMALNAIIMPMT